MRTDREQHRLERLGEHIRNRFTQAKQRHYPHYAGDTRHKPEFWVRVAEAVEHRQVSPDVLVDAAFRVFGNSVTPNVLVSDRVLTVAEGLVEFEDRQARFSLDLMMKYCRLMELAGHPIEKILTDRVSTYLTPFFRHHVARTLGLTAIAADYEDYATRWGETRPQYTALIPMLETYPEWSKTYDPY